MQLRFQAVHEPKPGMKWKSHFDRTWPAYSAWFLREGDESRPGYLTSRMKLEEHMPELVPLWERLTELSGGTDQAARLLSLYNPTPYLSGCSQALWTRGEPILVRNYDYHPGRIEGTFLASEWHDTRVIASMDSLWGALDGLNEHGLAVSLAFGGRKVVGDGFGIPLVLRYILEFSRTVEEAVEVLKRVPSHMAYTVALMDREGAYKTVLVAPDRPAEVTDKRVSTNHQNDVEWHEHAELTDTLAREELLADKIHDEDETAEQFVSRFTEPPIRSLHYERAFGTLYTAIYWPERGEVEYRWPNRSWHQSFELFVEGVAVIDFGTGKKPRH